MIGLERRSPACLEAREDQIDPIAIERVAIHRRHCADCQAWEAAIADIQLVCTADDRLDDLTRARIQQRLAKGLDEVATDRAKAASPRRWLGAMAAVAALVLVALLWRGSPIDPRIIDVPTGGRVGARVGEAYLSLIGPARAALPEEPSIGSEVRLERGRLLVEVEHHPGLEFSVSTPQARVKVVGTLFAVTVDSAGRTYVDVRRGVVEVTSQDDLVRVEAGRGWDRARGLRSIDPGLDRALDLHGTPEAAAEPEAATKPEVAPDVEPTPPAPAPQIPRRRAPAPIAPTAEARYADAEVALAKGDRATAEAILTEVVRQFATDPLASTALYELARLAYDHGERGVARAHLEELLSRGADPSLLESAHYLLCRLDIDAQAIDPAYECLVRFRRSFTGSPRDAEVLATIAGLAERRGGCAEAESWWSEYLRLYPSGPKANELEARRVACAR